MTNDEMRDVLLSGGRLFATYGRNETAIAHSYQLSTLSADGHIYATDYLDSTGAEIGTYESVNLESTLGVMQDVSDDWNTM